MRCDICYCGGISLGIDKLNIVYLTHVRSTVIIVLYLINVNMCIFIVLSFDTTCITVKQGVNKYNFSVWCCLHHPNNCLSLSRVRRSCRLCLLMEASA